MFRIVIYDDEKRECDRTKHILERYAQAKGLTFEIKAMHNEANLLKHIRQHTDTDAAFLDICIGDGDAGGINTAKKINCIAPEVAIVFLTGYIEYATDVYDAEHIYFVLKDELEQRLDAIFMKLNLMMENRKKGCIHVHVKGKEIIIRESEILYIERQGRITSIQCKQERIEIPNRLSELEKDLSETAFVRCHNSFIVNLAAVREFTRTEFLLADGMEIPISRYKVGEVREKFFAWSK